ARTDLNFRSPETISTWYSRWRDELDAGELALLVWGWQTRFGSLSELAWLRYGDTPLYVLLYEIQCIVRETPEPVRAAERWRVPNKLTHRPSTGGR
ncbi:plasmid SOS inhibition protein A, partial [Phytobacter ursingii]